MRSAADTSRLAAVTLALAGLGLAGACGGKGAGGPCPVLSDCGGDPTGSTSPERADSITDH